VVVSGNPLARIKDLANVRLVMKNGRAYTLAELEAPFAAPASSGAAAPSPASVHGKDAQTWWHDPEEMIEDDHR
jgi:hypothetical protein